MSMGNVSRVAGPATRRTSYHGKSGIPSVFFRLRVLLSIYRTILLWRLAGKPVPTPHTVKQRAIAQYGRRFRARVLIETGTYVGDMVDAQRGNFREVYSIELSPEYARRATERFAADQHIHIVQGDSADGLAGILKRVSERCVFWLDGHYSGGDTARGALEYPVLRELAQIGEHGIRDHVILIDDARLFIGDENAPSKAAVTDAIRAINPHYVIEDRDDIIRAAVRTSSR